MEVDLPIPLLVVTGANGFIGRHFLHGIDASGIRVRALTRVANDTNTSGQGVERVAGDLSDGSVWDRLLEPGCTVVNLAYSQSATIEDAVAATRAMVSACNEAKVARLVHCGTVSVYGRTTVNVIDESTPCNPIDEYGRQKLAIEEALLHSGTRNFELAVLRPSQVFGAGGLALRTLCGHLLSGSRLVNYCRSSLFNRRSMHLVPVETVVAALWFLCAVQRPLDREVFIISDDDDPKNNFQDVEHILMEALHLPDYAFARTPVPRGILKTLLKLKGRGEIDPATRFLCDKLLGWGFERPLRLETALRQFAATRPPSINFPPPA